MFKMNKETIGELADTRWLKREVWLDVFSNCLCCSSLNVFACSTISIHIPYV